MPMIDPDTNYLVLNPSNGSGVFVAPQSNGRARAYVGIPRTSSYRFQGISDLPQFVQDSVAAGAPSQWYSDIRPIGPLATFDGADTWVESPAAGGVVLIGDAASSSDPTYGQGQALSLRDARVLSEQLAATDDWQTAVRAYAKAHDGYYGALHRFTEWFWQLFLETGPIADERRGRALPLLAQDPTRLPDVLTSGPDLALDETVRRRFFGEV
jgi:2-polyprenyl-6-methoxyphenol hydroxylase-like FAD-dependent oxidoreductase